MKKLMVLAMMATLLMAGSAFAVTRNLTVTPNATFQFGAPGTFSGPTTTNNDDSCDIGTAPAATLLLPYFEVDFNNRTQTTLFTITNVTRYSQIAHVTVWTDFSFPVLDFNIFLTGYDVQPINLMDILTSGVVAQSAGTGPTTAQSPIGSPNLNAAPNYSNPNFSASIGCSALPGQLPPTLVAAVRTALTTGVYNPGGGASCASAVGSTHANAIGYITVDVAANCSTRLPNDPAYYANDILFDNVLIGDYEQLGPAAALATGGSGTATSFDGAGNPMVHIRAVPEGGGAGSNPGTNLPYTYYDRYQVGTNHYADRRQPLPATWAARYIQGGTGGFATNYKIWREGFGSGTCGASLALNGALPIAEVVRFDEHENPFVLNGPIICSPCSSTPGTLPETSSTNSANSLVYPALGGSDIGGWMYLNLNNGGSAAYTVNHGGISSSALPSGLAPVGSTTVLGPRPSQNWVVIEMFGSVSGATGTAANRLSVDFDAAWLGNGCSAAAFLSTADGGTVPIGPAGGVFVCPPGFNTTSGAPCTGTNVTPLP